MIQTMTILLFGKPIGVIRLEVGVAWNLSPAYDMGFCYNPRGQWANAHQMSVAGKRDHITQNDLLVFAAKQDIKDPEEVIQQVEYGISRFPEHADDCGVPKSETDYIMAQINERRKELTH